MKTTNQSVISTVTKPSLKALMAGKNISTKPIKNPTPSVKPKVKPKAKPKSNK